MPLRPGRQTTEKPALGEIRSLAREDLALLAETRPKTQLQSLRDKHHRIARAVASGMSNGEIASVCGISYNRVSILNQDPAFAELVAHYRALVTADWIEAADPVIDFLGSVRTKSLAMLEDKLVAAEEQGEFLPTRELVSMAELGLDRTGYGKVNKNVNINVDFAAQLEAARNRSRTAREANPVRETPTPPRSALAFDSSPPQSAQVQAPSNFRRRV
jgi:hypothetical protein